MVAKNVDSKGRISLGDKYSGGTMLVEHAKDGTIVLRPAVTIPVREQWLFKNKKALALVMKGLEQARRREFVKGPDMDAARRIADQIADDD